jgi:hypothetical protein
VCIDCCAAAQIACLLNQYKSTLASKDRLKGNTQEWLLGFLNYAGLQYLCPACQQRPRGQCQQTLHVCSGDSECAAEHSKTFALQFKEAELLKKDIATLRSTVAAMSESFSQLFQQVGDVGSKLPDLHQDSSKLPSYADALSSYMVKAAVSEAIREHHKTCSENAMRVIYDFPEEGHDQNQVQKMLEFLECACNLPQLTMIGRSMSHGNASSPRPIKLELKTAKDAERIMSKAKYLRQDDYYYCVTINKWLSQAEVAAVRQQRKTMPSDELGISMWQ